MKSLPEPIMECAEVARREGTGITRVPVPPENAVVGASGN